MKTTEKLYCVTHLLYIFGMLCLLPNLLPAGF